MRLAIITLLLAPFLYGQGEIVVSPQFLTTAVQTTPGAIPTSLTCVVGKAVGCVLKLAASSGDPYVCAADFVGTGQTITLQDVNSITWLVAGGTLGSAGNPAGWEWHAVYDGACRWFPGGVYVQAGSSGVTGHLVIKYNK